MSLSTLDRSHLAEDAYKDRSREAVAVDRSKKTVWVGGREYEVFAHTSKPSGYQGTAYRELPNGEVVIASRGTEFNPLSPEFLRDVVRADGGMVAKAVNIQAHDAVVFAQEAIEITKARAKERNEPMPRITAVGHSLGGTHAQIQSYHLGLEAETFNAFGATRLKIMQGQPAPGAHAVNHMDAADFVSAASPHFGEQRVYATEADIAHLRKQDYGLGPYRPDVLAMTSPTTTLAQWFVKPDPVTAALSPHGIGAHGIATMAPDRRGDASVLTEENRQRYEHHKALVDAYRNDIGDITRGVSAHARNWSFAVNAIDRSAQQATLAIEGAGIAIAPTRAAQAATIRLGQSVVDEAPRIVRETLDRTADATLGATMGLSQALDRGIDRASEVAGSAAALGRNALDVLTPATEHGMVRKAHPDKIPTDRSPGALDPRFIESSSRQFLQETSRPHHAEREPLTYLDTAHPHHRLFRELREKLPADVSNEKVAELTLAARQGGVRPNRVESVHVLGNGDAWVLGTIPGFDGTINLRTPAPPITETMQKADAFEQQHQARVAQWQEQRQQSQSHGRSM
ncbi:DUF6792 domain-containing protein [Lysobacter panacisoli]|uniref:DUF6792 domain-containing protein n=1 Tax=Lysobacter panacisoli TaxID=1255263 RepID=A0ABP9LIY8_9GAMM|nr:DUF6792 domain-containing protein [Lysobacter panacisoli]